MAKISTKTFNPMAGVSIPGWALESYQSTSSDLDSVVNSLTDAYNKQQDREAALGLEAFQMNQEQNNFDAQMEFKKQDAEKRRTFEREKEDNDKKYKRDLLRANELKEENDTNWRNYTASKSILDSSISNFTVGEYDEKLAVLNAYDTRGNSQVRQLRESYINSANQDKSRVENRAVNIGRMLPTFTGKEWVDLRSDQKEYLIGMSKETLNPANGQVFQKLISRSWFPNEDIDPVLKAEIDVWANKGKTVSLGNDEDAMRAWRAEGDLLSARYGTQVSPSISAEKKLDMGGDDITPKGTDLYNTLYSGISYDNEEIFTDPRSIKVGPGGEASYEIEFEDGRVERVDADSIESQFPTDFNRDELLSAMNKPDDRGILEKASDVYESYKSGGLRDVKDSFDEWAMGTDVAKFIEPGLDYLEDIYQSVKKEDAVPPAPIRMLGLDELSESGKFVNNSLRTVARFFPQVYEDWSLLQAGELKKYAGQGLSGHQMVKKARDEIREKRAGVYYTGKDSKYLTKRELIGQGNIIMSSDDYDVDIARLPNKMVNPNYIEDKVESISGDMAESMSNLSNPNIAGKALKNSKDKLSKSQKDLVRLRKEVVEAEKYRLPGVYKVSLKQIDNAIAAIIEARKKQTAPERKRLKENLNKKTEEMIKSQSGLDSLLELDRQRRLQKPFYESPAGDDPFGVLY